MPAELKQKWVAALRSGDYKQGHMYLYDPQGGYCCLGVLEHMCDGEVEWLSDGVSLGVPSIRWMKLHGIKAFGTEHDHTINDPDVRDLTRMNDGLVAFDSGSKSFQRLAPQSFNAIANWIEKNIEVIDERIPSE